MTFKVKNFRKYLKPILFILVGIIIGSSMLCGCNRQDLQEVAQQILMLQV